MPDLVFQVTDEDALLLQTGVSSLERVHDIPWSATNILYSLLLRHYYLGDLGLQLALQSMLLQQPLPIFELGF